MIMTGTHGARREARWYDSPCISLLGNEPKVAVIQKSSKHCNPSRLFRTFSCRVKLRARKTSEFFCANTTVVCTTVVLRKKKTLFAEESYRYNTFSNFRTPNRAWDHFRIFLAGGECLHVHSAMDSATNTPRTKKTPPMSIRVRFWDAELSSS